MASINSKDKFPQIYVSPTLERFKRSDISLLFLPDGNNRAQKSYKLNYSDGGQNVVNMIYALAERGDIGKVIFALLSRENILKREDKFFEDMYQAFLGLGMKIQNNNEIVKAEISLQLCGDMQLLRERGAMGEKLADMIEAVMKLTTDKVVKPRMKVQFGIDYNEDTVLQNNVDLVLRSGMDKEGCFRSSGLKVDTKVVNYGFADLWPKLSPEKVNQVVDEVKSSEHRYWNDGHDLDILDELNRQYLDFDASITIPVNTVLDYTKLAIHAAILGADRARRIEVYDKNGQRKLEAGNPNSHLQIKVVDSKGLQQYVRDNNAYFNTIIAPGQLGQKFVLQPVPAIDYATVFGSGTSAQEIIDTVRGSVEYFKENPPLSGGSREMLVVSKDLSSYINGEKPDQKKFLRYRSMQHFYSANKEKNLKDLAAKLCSMEKVDSEKEKYNIMADLFVGKMLHWANENGLTFSTSEELTAFANYAHTSLFLTYYPNHSDWTDLSKDWDKHAECMAEYMEIVYMLDDRIFDLKMPTDEKKKELDFATKHLKAAINGCKLPVREEFITAEVVEILSNAIDDLRNKIQREGNPLLFRKWQEVFAKLIDCHRNEYIKSEEIIEIPDITEEIAVADSKKQKVLKEIIDSANQDSQEVGDSNDCFNQELISYLSDIEDSIGAAMAYRTLIASNKEEMNDEFSECYEELCLLVNIYFRLANDFAEVFRTMNDKEDGIDSLKILGKKYQNQNSSIVLIKVAANLHILMKKAKAMILQHREYLMTIASDTGQKQLAIAIVRSDIGELFYKGTHYRRADRSLVAEFFDQLFELGINKYNA